MTTETFAPAAVSWRESTDVSEPLVVLPHGRGSTETGTSA